MADVKISEVPDADPLDRTEVIPVVQAVATKKTTVDNILGEIVDADIPLTLARTTDVTDAVSDHEGAVNPHPTYLTQAEGDAAYEATGAVAAHAAAGNPHPSYATDTDLSTHEADTSVHGVADTTALLTETTHDALDHTGLPGVSAGGGGGGDGVLYQMGMIR